MSQNTVNIYTEPNVKERIPTIFEDLSEAELSNELEKGYEDMLSGKVKPIETVFANIRNRSK